MNEGKYCIVKKCANCGQISYMEENRCKECNQILYIQIDGKEYEKLKGQTE